MVPFGPENKPTLQQPDDSNGTGKPQHTEDGVNVEKKEGKKMEKSLKKGKEKMVEIEKKMSVVKVFDLN